MAWLKRNGWKYVLAAFIVVAPFVCLGVLHYGYARAARRETSSIVLTYRTGGGVNTDVDGLRDFMRGHHALAMQLWHDCLPIQMQINQGIDTESGKEREMSWARSDEGHICLVAREASSWPAEDNKGLPNHN